MSVQTLYTAATGMTSLETKLDVIANNLANVNTTGFKRDRANFEDLYYRNIKLPGVLDPQQGITPVGIHVGLGSRVQSTQTDFGTGAFVQTNNPFDVAIEGKGFFQVTDTDGTPVYTRAGNFSVNANNQLVIGSANTGRVLNPPVTIPIDATGVTIGSDGQVFVQQAGQTNFSQAGQIQLVNFINPEGLLKLGENLYRDTPASGAGTPQTPGTQGLGRLRQSALEQSNVEPVRELIDLITTQRSFELNSQAVQAGDQLLQLVANLRRF